MHLILMADIFMVPAIVVGLALALLMRGSMVARAFAVFIAAAALAPALIGVGGYFWGMSRVNEAIEGADPAYIDAIRAMGTAEAMLKIWFGAGSLACTLPGAAMVLAAAFLSKKGAEPPES